MDQIGSDIKSVLDSVLKEFLNFPDSLVLSIVEMERRLIVNVQAHAEDTPKLIGTRGTMVAALKTVVELMGVRFQKAGILIIVDPICPECGAQTERGIHRRVTQCPKCRWDSSSLGPVNRLDPKSGDGQISKRCMEDICRMIFGHKIDVRMAKVVEHSRARIGATFIDIVIPPAIRDDYPVDRLEEALQTIVNAVGKANNELVYLETVKLGNERNRNEQTGTNQRSEKVRAR